jgi:hypothetical protein
VTTLDPLGLRERETTRLVRELHTHGVGVRTLTDLVKLDTTPPLTAVAEAALALLGQCRQLAEPARWTPDYG